MMTKVSWLNDVEKIGPHQQLFKNEASRQQIWFYVTFFHIVGKWELFFVKTDLTLKNIFFFLRKDNINVSKMSMHLKRV